ncbi:hypothetical protein CTI12_AA552080 [Artemisia annua]|uniref:Uncharacterized protein n=1 Tax=Artemisia annua TaxID=35608 RepID=A0A2U1KYE0_ARTAN|nr:hypothetical protein CTI12_AA552080 [Artemisia annua]
MGSVFVTQENGIPVFYPNTTTYDDYMITESQASLLRTLYGVSNQPPVVAEQIRLPRRYLEAAQERKARAQAVAQISHGVSVLNLGQSIKC